ncbi:hypothetical protein CARUB_v100126982mg, partial [Capsella rubella]
PPSLLSPARLDLILLEGSKNRVIWNPTMKQFFTLPEPQGTKEGQCHPR